MSQPYTLDREVVLADDLAVLLQKLIDADVLGYVVQTGNPPETSGVLGRVASQSGVPERRVWGILHGENAMVDLDTADRLLLAFGRFVELELPDSIVPEWEAKQAAAIQTQLMRHWARARGRVWPTERREMKAHPQRIRKEVWAAERGTAAA